MNYTSIVDKILRGESLQSVLDEMAEYLQAAICVLRVNLDIIAFSKTVPMRDPYWRGATEAGKCSEEMLTKIFSTSPANRYTGLTEIDGSVSYAPDDVTLKYTWAIPGANYFDHALFLTMPIDDKFDKKKQDLLLSFALLVTKVYSLQGSSMPDIENKRRKENLQRLLEPSIEKKFWLGTKQFSANDRDFTEERIFGTR